MDSPYAPHLSGPVSPVPAGPPRVFRHPASARWAAIAKLIGGGLLAFLALGMFALHIFLIHPDTLTLHATTTAPLIMAMFLISAAVSSLKNPGRVEVTDEAIVFHPGLRIAWQDIAFASVDDPAGANQKQLCLLDRAGKKLARIPGTIENFPELVTQVREKVTQHTPEEVTADVRTKKARRQALLTGGGTLLLLAAGVFIFRDAAWNRHVHEQLSQAAVEGEGVVSERFIAPNGVTHRIRYTVTGLDGRSAEHNVEVSQEVYRELAVGDRVAIRYVPEEPEISQLAAGEIRDADLQDSPTMSYLLGAAAIAMSLFMAAVTVMLWKGYDFKIDEKGARFVALGD